MSNRVTDSINAYLQTLEDSGHSSLPRPVHTQPLGQWKCRQESSPKSSDVHTSLKNTTVGSASQEAEQCETAFVPLRETARVQPAPVPQKHSPVQGNGHVGLKYLGLAFNKLGISNGLPALGDARCTDYVICPDGVRSQLKQPSEGASKPADQSQHARRRLQMGGEASVYEKSFSSCDVKSLVSDWSVNSWSTFNTRDEQEFRNGLAALDASIASLQRTLRADFKR